MGPSPGPRTPAGPSGRTTPAPRRRATGARAGGTDLVAAERGPVGHRLRSHPVPQDLRASPSRPSSGGRGRWWRPASRPTSSTTPSTTGGPCGRSVLRPVRIDGTRRCRWSPLPASRTWPGARRAAAGLTEVAKSSVGTMADGDFWYATATKMLAPLLFAAAFGGRDMADVVRWVDTQEEAEVLDLLDAAGVAEAVNAARVGLRQGGPAAEFDLHHGRDHPRAVRRRGTGRRPAAAGPMPAAPSTRPGWSGGQHALPVRPGPRPAPTDPPLRRRWCARSSSTSTTWWPGPTGRWTRRC